MSTRARYLAAISIVLILLVAAECAGRPPWPGAGDGSKDRTAEAESLFDQR